MSLKNKMNNDFLSLNCLTAKSKRPLFVFDSLVVSYGVSYENCQKVEAYFSELGTEDVVFVDIIMDVPGFYLLISSLLSHCTVILGHHYLSDAQKKEFCNLPEVTHVFHLVGNELILDRIKKSHKHIIDAAPYIGVLSSGTTKKPKCIKHDLQTLTHSLHHNRYDNKTWFCSYPLTHYAGLQVLIKTLFSQGTLIVSCPSKVHNDLNNMIQYKCNYINCTPSYLRKLLFSADRKKLDQLSIEVITLGGEPTDQVLLDKVSRLFPNTQIFHIYASTELGPVFLIKDKKEGFPAAWIDNEKAKLSEKRELIIKKRSFSMRGYSNQPGEVSDWFATGDLVEVKNDRALLVGRVDELINVGGYKINPLDVEKIILSTKGVVDVLVHGVKNPVIGSLVEALVKLDSSVNPSEIKSTILANCHALLSEYAGPHLVRFVDEIPLSAVGKKIRLTQG